MDEEDLADAEEAKKLQTSDSFTGLGTTEEDVSQRGAFMDMLKTGGDTMGVQLLRKMGWRDGQGVGPKVRRKAVPDNDDDPRETEGQETHLFAPENSQMISFIRKNDQKGLGFEGEGRLADASRDEADGVTSQVKEAQDDDTLPTLRKVKKKPSVKQGGFGVGVLNDNGSEDEDPYQMGPQISYTRVLGGDKKKKKPETGKASLGTSNPLLRTKPVFISKKAASSKANGSLRRCHDGRLSLDGFLLSTNSEPLSLNQDNKYPAPAIPKDWKSSKTPPSTATNPPFTSTTYQSSASLARASTLNPSTRAALLGETALPGKSVFSYLSPTARSRIVTLTNNPNLPPALNEAPPPGYASNPAQRVADLASLVPPLDPSIATTALGRGIGGWMPYAEDPAKRTRYRSFLEIRAELQQGLPDRAEGMSTDDWVKEMNEFARAAQIFKPMTGMMASRFTSASSSAPTSLQQESSQKSAGTGNDDTASALSTPAPKPTDPAEEAATLGMYGPLTRSTAHFFPTRLLCKRFNVKPPDHVQLDPANDTAPGNGTAASHSSSSSGANTMTSTNEKNTYYGDRSTSSGMHRTASAAQPQPQPQPQKRLQLVGGKEWEELKRESGVRSEGYNGEENLSSAAAVVVVDPERNEALEKERPGDAVFKAIFGSDSDSEGEGEGEGDGDD